MIHIYILLSLCVCDLNVYRDVDWFRVFYPELQCEQVIKFDSWPRSMGSAMDSRQLFVGDARGVFHIYWSNWNPLMNSSRSAFESRCTSARGGHRNKNGGMSNRTMESSLMSSSSAIVSLRFENRAAHRREGTCGGIIGPPLDRDGMPHE